MTQLKEALLNDLMQSQDISVTSPYEHRYFGESTRSLSFFGEVETTKAELFISQLLHLEELDPEEPITVFLNTEGGSLMDALAIYDAIRICSCPVIIISTGLCSSAGLLILSAGDFRMATSNTVFFYHQPIVANSTIDSISSMNAFKDHYIYCQEIADNIIKTKTRIKKSIWNKFFEGKTSYYFDALKAYEYNMIDQIVESRKVKFKIKKDK